MGHNRWKIETVTSATPGRLIVVTDMDTGEKHSFKPFLFLICICHIMEWPRAAAARNRWIVTLRVRGGNPIRSWV